MIYHTWYAVMVLFVVAQVVNIISMLSKESE